VPAGSDATSTRGEIEPDTGRDEFTGASPCLATDDEGRPLTQSQDVRHEGSAHKRHAVRTSGMPANNDTGMAAAEPLVKEVILAIVKLRGSDVRLGSQRSRSQMETRS
jgi:hypothetical protein